MTYKRKLLAFSLSAILGLPWISSGANASCLALPGTWFFYAMQGESPGIVTQNQTVMTSPTSQTTVTVFPTPNPTPGYKNDTSGVIQCKMTVLADGSFTAPCAVYHVDGSPAGSGPITGTLALTSCKLTGSLTVDDPNHPLISIRSGHINGGSGSGIATQGRRVLLFTIVKQ